MQHCVLYHKSLLCIRHSIVWTVNGKSLQQYNETLNLFCGILCNFLVELNLSWINLGTHLRKTLVGYYRLSRLMHTDILNTQPIWLCKCHICTTDNVCLQVWKHCKYKDRVKTATRVLRSHIVWHTTLSFSCRDLTWAELYVHSIFHLFVCDFIVHSTHMLHSCFHFCIHLKRSHILKCEMFFLIKKAGQSAI